MRLATCCTLPVPAAPSAARPARRRSRRRTPGAPPRTVRFWSDRCVIPAEALGESDLTVRGLYASTRTAAGHVVTLALGVSEDGSGPPDIAFHYADASGQLSAPLKLHGADDLDATLAVLRALILRAKRTHLLPAGRAA